MGLTWFIIQNKQVDNFKTTPNINLQLNKPANVTYWPNSRSTLLSVLQPFILQHSCQQLKDSSPVPATCLVTLFFSSLSGPLLSLSLCHNHLRGCWVCWICCDVNTGSLSSSSRSQTANCMANRANWQQQLQLAADTSYFKKLLKSQS